MRLHQITIILERMSDTLSVEHEERIRNHALLFDTPQQAVIGTTSSGIITYWSRGAAALYGWEAGDVLGKDIVEITPAVPLRDAAAEIMERMRAGRSWTGDFKVRSRDGTEFNATVQNIPVGDAQGHLVGIVGVSRPTS